MKVKKYFYLKCFNVSLLQLRFSVLYIYSFYIYIHLHIHLYIHMFILLINIVSDTEIKEKF